MENNSFFDVSNNVQVLHESKLKNEFRKMKKMSFVKKDKMFDKKTNHYPQFPIYSSDDDLL